jgi:hypothetical protein
VQDDPQPLSKLRLGRHRERGARGPDALFGAAYPLAHGRLRHQEGARDLRRAQAADGAQGERELRCGGKGGVAAQDEQREGVVALGDRGGRGLHRHRVLAAPARLLAAQFVGQAAARHRDEPCAGVAGHPLSRPLRRGGQQRLLHGVLAGVEAPMAVDEGAEDLRRQLAQQVLVAVLDRHISSPEAIMRGRSSTAQ